MDPVFRALYTTTYYGLDLGARIGQDFSATSSVCKAVNLWLKFINRGLEIPDQSFVRLSVALKVITDTSSCRGLIRKLFTLISGRAGGEGAADWIWIAPDVPIPNILKIASISVFLASDILGSLNWLDNLEIIHLGKLAEGIGNLPFFGKLVVTLALQETMNTLNVIGIVLDIYDATRDMYQNRLTFYNSAQVIGDVAKLVGIVFAASTGTFLIIAIIADGTAVFCSLSRFVMESYDIGM